MNKQLLYALSISTGTFIYFVTRPLKQSPPSSSTPIQVSKELKQLILNMFLDLYSRIPDYIYSLKQEYGYSRVQYFRKDEEKYLASIDSYLQALQQTVTRLLNELLQVYKISQDQLNAALGSLLYDKEFQAQLQNTNFIQEVNLPGHITDAKIEQGVNYVQQKLEELYENYEYNDQYDAFRLHVKLCDHMQADIEWTEEILVTAIQKLKARDAEKVEVIERKIQELRKSQVHTVVLNLPRNS